MSARRIEDLSVARREAAVAHAFPQAGMLLEWFRPGYSQNRPATEGPFALFSGMLAKRGERMDIETAMDVARNLVVEVAEFTTPGHSIRAQEASLAALHGFPDKASFAFNRYPGDILPVSEDQLRAVSYLVKATQLGAGEPGFSFYDLTHPAKEALDLGIMHLVEAIPFRRPTPPTI